MSFADKIRAATSRKGLAILVVILLLYFLWLDGLSTNPPGFYVDEGCLAYNAHLIATTGAEDDGKTFPLYIHCYTQGWSQYHSPSQVYALALPYLFISPSVLSARIFAATLVFLATLLLGLLAAKISGRTSVGIIVALTAMATPWIFEFSRLVMETFVLIPAIVLFLYCLYAIHNKERWRFTDILCLALLLTLITYSYATGRVIGPLFGLGLLIFAVNWHKFFAVVKIGVIYALTMIPLVVVYIRDPLVISGRFLRATNLDKADPLLDNLGRVVSALWQDFSLGFFIFTGDELLRHHVPNSGMGELFIATFALGILGLIVIVIRHRKSTWWRFTLYGAFASMLPGAITFERHHAMRELAFPIFFLIYTVPAISWLTGLYEKRQVETPSGREVETTSSRSRDLFWRRALLGTLLVLTAVQAAVFQVRFRTNGVDINRIVVFNGQYKDVLDNALQQEERPIYLHDSGEPTYILGFWYAATEGYDRSNFVHLLDGQQPPSGALVITGKGSCTDCQVLFRNGGYLLYRNQAPDLSGLPAPVPASGPQNRSVFSGQVGSEPGQLSDPRGLAVDANGNIYVADTGNSRVEKFDPSGKFLIEFGASGPPDLVLKSPNGVAVAADGSIFVSDAATQRLTRFNPDGTFGDAREGPDSGFYGPRGIAVGPNKQVYVVDQGRSRIVAYDPQTKTYPRMWGNNGVNPLEFKDATGIAIGDDLVFVADLSNGRIQTFDLAGNFVKEWPVAAWSRTSDENPDVEFDSKTKTVYVTSPKTNEILAFDLDGHQLAGFAPTENEKLSNPTSMAIAQLNNKRWLYVLNSGFGKISKFELANPKKLK